MRFTIFRIGWSLVFLSSIIAFYVDPRLDDKLTVHFLPSLQSACYGNRNSPNAK